MKRQKVTVQINSSVLLISIKQAMTLGSLQFHLKTDGSTLGDEEGKADDKKLKVVCKPLTGLTWPYLVSTHARIRKYLVYHLQC